MANGSIGMSGHSFDAFVSSQRTYSNEYDLAAKIQEKYYRARQKFLAKIEKKEDSCIVLSDSKLDAKLEIYRSIDKSCASLTNILEDYQNLLYVYANEENSLGILLKECSKYDKTKAGKIMSITGKSLSQSSHQRIKLYMPLLRIYQEMETFHSRAVEDTAETVDRLENKRSQYRASLLWMKDISERLNPDVYKQLDRFRRVQNQVRNDKKIFDTLQMDVVQKIDLLMASRCNLMNQILATYQAILLETFERNYNNFRSIEELIKKEDIYEYEFKTLKQLNPILVSNEEADLLTSPKASEMAGGDESATKDKDDNNNPGSQQQQQHEEALIDISSTSDAFVDTLCEPVKANSIDDESDDIIDQLEQLFGSKDNKTDGGGGGNSAGAAMTTTTTAATTNSLITTTTATIKASSKAAPVTPFNLLDDESSDIVDQLEQLFGAKVTKTTDDKLVETATTTTTLPQNLLGDEVTPTATPATTNCSELLSLNSEVSPPKLDMLDLDFDAHLSSLMGESGGDKSANWRRQC